jgi:hypothetical protein
LIFDENGNLIRGSGNKSLKQIFVEKAESELKIICNFLKIDNIPKLKLRNGKHGGGNFAKVAHEITLNLGDAEYCRESRRTLIHEALHAKGHEHGYIKGHKFYSRDDKYSPVLSREIFSEVLKN